MWRFRRRCPTPRGSERVNGARDEYGDVKPTAPGQYQRVITNGASSGWYYVGPAPAAPTGSGTAGGQSQPGVEEIVVTGTRALVQQPPILQCPSVGICTIDPKVFNKIDILKTISCASGGALVILSRGRVIRILGFGALLDSCARG
jgi:hypothetical protein